MTTITTYAAAALGIVAVAVVLYVAAALLVVALTEAVDR